MLARGIVGLFVGPIILAVTWELMMAWIREERADAAVTGAEQSTTEKVAAMPSV
jgi:predicted PurR-regulated permease PerM